MIQVTTFDDGARHGDCSFWGEVVAIDEARFLQGCKRRQHVDEGDPVFAAELRKNLLRLGVGRIVLHLKAEGK